MNTLFRQSISINIVNEKTTQIPIKKRITG